MENDEDETTEPNDSLSQTTHLPDKIFEDLSPEVYALWDKCAECVEQAINYTKKTIEYFREGVELARKEGKPDEVIGALAKVHLKKKIKKSTLNRWIHDELGIVQYIETPELPIGQFDVIVADPPWQYENAGVIGAASKHFSTMNLEDIKNMKEKLPIYKDSVLFLWATQALIKEALEVMESWGFEYKSGFVWIKRKGRMGIGFYVRGQHELLLIGIKGNMSPPEESNRYPSIIETDKEEHSKKPDIAYDIIEHMYPSRNYLELFARDKREGWEVWGGLVTK